MKNVERWPARDSAAADGAAATRSMPSTATSGESRSGCFAAGAAGAQEDARRPAHLPLLEVEGVRVHVAQALDLADDAVLEVEGLLHAVRKVLVVVEPLGVTRERAVPARWARDCMR